MQGVHSAGAQDYHKSPTEHTGASPFPCGDAPWGARRVFARNWRHTSLTALQIGHQGALEARGRKFLAVMKKSSKLYPETGGWGFEVFQGYQDKGSLKSMKECFDCHSAQKRRDYVYSEYVE